MNIFLILNQIIKCLFIYIPLILGINYFLINFKSPNLLKQLIILYLL